MGRAGICIFPYLYLFEILFIFVLDSTIPVESDTDDEGAPRISLAEMLEDLHISQDATGGEGESMMTWVSTSVGSGCWTEYFDVLFCLCLRSERREI